MKTKNNYYIDTFGKKNDGKMRASKKSSKRNIIEHKNSDENKSHFKSHDDKYHDRFDNDKSPGGFGKSGRHGGFGKSGQHGGFGKSGRHGGFGKSGRHGNSDKSGRHGGVGKREFWRPGNMLYPLPAVMVSCCRKGEKPNIITVAWTGTICSDPAMVFISVRKERYSYDIIKESGEFVINLTTDELAWATDFCGVKSGRDIDKFKAANLTPKPSKHISVPYIAESPVSIECHVTQIVPLGSHDMFIAEVLGISIDSSYLDPKGKLDLESADMLVYSHGEYHRMGKLLGTFGYSVKK